MSWQRIRLQALERDGFICQECHERKEFMEVHHKIPRKMGGLDILDNLITLCRKCHFHLHSKDNTTDKVNITWLSQVADPEIQPIQRQLDQGYDPPTNPYENQPYYGRPYTDNPIPTGNRHYRTGIPFETDPLRRTLSPKILPKSMPSLGPARTLSKHKYGAQAI